MSLIHDELQRKLSQIFEWANARAALLLKDKGFDKKAAQILSFKELIKEQIQNENSRNTTR